MFWFQVKEFNIWYAQSMPGSFVGNLHFEHVGEIDLQGLASCYVFGYRRDCWRQTVLEKFVVGDCQGMYRTLYYPKFISAITKARRSTYKNTKFNPQFNPFITSGT
jgi:hypothetical protein